MVRWPGRPGGPGAAGGGDRQIAGSLNRTQRSTSGGSVMDATETESLTPPSCISHPWQRRVAGCSRLPAHAARSIPARRLPRPSALCDDCCRGPPNGGQRPARRRTRPAARPAAPPASKDQRPERRYQSGSRPGRKPSPAAAHAAPSGWPGPGAGIAATSTKRRPAGPSASPRPGPRSRSGRPAGGRQRRGSSAARLARASCAAAVSAWGWRALSQQRRV